LDFLSVGGAELKNEVEKKLQQNSIGIAIGYGATECGTRITLATAQEYKSGSVGKVVSGLELKIADTGEILVKGENVMLGYYKDPEATAQKIDKDGWLHTGDKGYMDEDGYLYVTGRIGHDMIVLPNGENIHPEDIERKLNALPEVKESVVVARNGRLVALVVLEQQEDDTKQKENQQEQYQQGQLRHKLLRTINPQLPDYSQLYNIEFLDKPLERTAKQTIKRYLYK
jgi:long-chain acyl-CoA synthetase